MFYCCRASWTILPFPPIYHKHLSGVVFVHTHTHTHTQTLKHSNYFSSLQYAFQLMNQEKNWFMFTLFSVAKQFYISKVYNFTILISSKTTLKSEALSKAHSFNGQQYLFTHSLTLKKIIHTPLIIFSLYICTLIIPTYI